MRLYELYKHHQPIDIADLLTSKGYEYIDNGMFGLVYRKPGANNVLKVFRYDPCYLKFIQMARKHQDNPYFPKVFGITKFGGRHTSKIGLYGVKLEILEPVSEREHDQLKRETQYSMYMMRWRPGQGIPFRKEFRKQYPDLAKALDLIGKIRAGCRIEMSPKNWMKRSDGQFVIIDPMVDLRYLGRSQVDPEPTFEEQLTEIASLDGMSGYAFGQMIAGQPPGNALIPDHREQLAVNFLSMSQANEVRHDEIMDQLIDALYKPEALDPKVISGLKDSWKAAMNAYKYGELNPAETLLNSTKHMLKKVDSNANFAIIKSSLNGWTVPA